MAAHARCPRCQLDQARPADPRASTLTCARCRFTFPLSPPEVIPVPEEAGARCRPARPDVEDLPEVVAAFPAVRDTIPTVTPAEPLPAEVVEAVWWSAQLRDGLALQWGYAVLRPNYFAFLPTTERTHLLWGAFGKLFWAVLGAEPLSYDPRYSLRLRFDDLARNGAAPFDERVRHAAGHREGVLWPWPTARLSREANPIWSRWDMLVFQAGSCLVRGVPPRARAEVVGRMVRRWAGDGPLPVRHPLILWTILTAVLTAPVVQILWGYFREGEYPRDLAGLLADPPFGLCAGLACALPGVLVCFFTLRAYLRAWRGRRVPGGTAGDEPAPPGARPGPGRIEPVPEGAGVRFLTSSPCCG